MNGRCLPITAAARGGASLVLLAAFLAAFLAGAGPVQARQISLAQAIDLARANRPEVAGAEAEVKLAELGILRARLQRVRLSLRSELTEQAQRLYLNAPAQLCQSIEGLCDTPARARLFDLSANLEVPLWAGFSLQAAGRRADRLALAAREQKRALLRRLTLEVTEAYWTARRLQLQREVAQRALQRKTDLAAVLNARARAGVVPTTDSARAQSAALRQQADVLELTGQVHQARSELAAVLQVDGEVEPTDNPGDQPMAVPPLAQMVAEVEQRRPEVRAAQAQLEAEEQRLREARGQLWPQVSLFGRASAQNEILGIPQDRPIVSLLAGLIVRWDLFDSLTTYTAIKEAELDRDRQAQSRRRALVLARTEVRVAYRKLESARAQRALRQQALTIAREGYQLLRRRYEAGSALLIELRDAEEELADLESDVIENAMACVRAEAELQTARGDP